MEHPGGVTIAALTDDNELLFVRQFRYPYETVLLELPAGKLDPAKTSPLRLPRENCREETGAVGKDYISLGTFYPSAGFCDEVLHLYFCKVASIGASHPDEDEFIEPILIPIEKAVEMVLNNEIPDGKTQVAVLKAAMLVNHKSLIERESAGIYTCAFLFIHYFSKSFTVFSNFLVQCRQAVSAFVSLRMSFADSAPFLLLFDIFFCHFIAFTNYFIICHINSPI